MILVAILYAYDMRWRPLNLCITGKLMKHSKVTYNLSLQNPYCKRDGTRCFLSKTFSFPISVVTLLTSTKSVYLHHVGDFYMLKLKLALEIVRFWVENRTKRSMKH